MLSSTLQNVIKKSNTLLICTNRTELEESTKSSNYHAKLLRFYLDQFKRRFKDFDENRIITIDESVSGKKSDIHGFYPHSLSKILQELNIPNKKFKYILFWFCSSLKSNINEKTFKFL